MSPDAEVEELIAIVLRALASVNMYAVAIRPADLPESKDALEQMLRAQRLEIWKTWTEQHARYNSRVAAS